LDSKDEEGARRKAEDAQRDREAEAKLAKLQREPSLLASFYSLLHAANVKRDVLDESHCVSSLSGIQNADTLMIGMDAQNITL
jgi:hypothetical protein